MSNSKKFIQSGFWWRKDGANNRILQIKSPKSSKN